MQRRHLAPDRRRARGDRRVTSTTRLRVDAENAGEVTARRLVEGCLAQIEACDQAGPALAAVVTVADDALTRAQELDDALSSSGPVGPLA